MKKCAVIVSAFNAPNDILRCIQSIEDQRPLADWNFEIRVGVDGCARTASMLEKARKLFWLSYENRGTYIMANSLVALGPADAYARFDADDYMLSDYLVTCIPIALDYGLCFATSMMKGNRVSGPRVGQVTWTREVQSKLGGFRGARVHSDRDFSRRAMMAGYDVQAMRQDPRLRQHGLFVHSTPPNSLTRSAIYGYRSLYRKKIKKEMAALRANGEIKVGPQKVKLKCIKPS